MPEFSCGGRALIEMALYWPDTGSWRARVEVDGETALSGQVQLELTGGVVLTGTVKSGGVSDSRVQATLTAGRALLTSTIIPGQHFYDTTPRTIVDNIMANTSGGPLLREMVNQDLPGVFDQSIARWMRIRTTADEALTRLTNHFGLKWWFDPDGRIRIGTPEYPDVRLSTVDVLPHDDPEWSRLVFASDDEIVQPRTTLVTDYGSYPVREVRYYLSRGRLRGVLYHA